MEQLGYDFAIGAMRAIGKILIIIIILTSVVSLVLDYFRIGFDSTDDHENGKRSDLKVHVDYGTGCEYLRARGGSLTPRLGPDGKQICRETL